MIRFSAALVIVGLGLLVAGAVAGNMTLVYTAIAVSVCAALVLTAGMIAGRDELFGRGATAEGAERTFDRGVTPGPGTAAIHREVAGAGLRSLGDRNLAAVSTQAGSPGPSYTGVGWPGGSPADELWARVDAELAAAGASSREPKLTKDSSSDEIWGRVEEELAGPAQWNTGLVIPAAEEAAPAEQEPAAEPPGQPAWADPAWGERPEHPGWADAADRTEQLVVVEWAEADQADRPGGAEASPAAGEAEANRWSLKPARSAAPGQEASIEWASIRPAGTREAGDRGTGAEAAPARDETAADGDGVVPDDAAAVADAEGVAPGRGESVPDGSGAGPDAAAAVPDAGSAGPDHAEAVVDRAGAAPDAGGAAPDAGGAAPDAGGAAQDRDNAAPDGDGDAPDSAEAVNGARPPGERADPDGAAPAAGAAAEPDGGPDAELLAAPLVTDASRTSSAPAAPYPSAATSYPPGRTAGPGPQPAPVIVVSGVPRYHRPGCILIRFLGQNDVESTTPAAAEASGCVPCRACQPDHLSSAAGPGPAAESGAVG